MVTLPISLGPSGDWDPQGYEEEEDDFLTPGMHLMDDEEEDDDDDLEEDDIEAVIVDDDDEDEEDEDDKDDGYGDLEKDALAELEELEDLVLQSEKETLKLTDFAEEE
ncbi:hypothetical protein KKG46_05485 [Patescibacteria group bacterium]|nr:hypothetical protein [Patescibacteria group bacterium]